MLALHPRVLILLLMLCALLGGACDRSRKALLTTPGAATSGVRLECPQVDNMSYPENRAYVLVTDQADVPLAHFSIGNFVVSEDNKPSVVTGVARVNRPLSVVLCLDRSGSMGGTTTTNANNAARQFVDALGGSDSVEIIDFSSRASVAQEFTTDKDLLKGKINAARCSGATALYDAIGLAAEELKNRPGRKFILVMTDGYENVSQKFKTPGQVVDAVNKSGVAAYIVGLGVSIDTVSLQAIADNTGGRFYQAPGSSQLAAYFVKILELMQNLVEVNFRSRNGFAVKDLAIYLNYGSFTAGTHRTYGY
jgi:VWFA-related protein